MKIEINEVVPNIFHVKFKSRKDLGSTFMRFQEYYENPRFKGQHFSRQTFIKWYKSQYGSFSYYTDWSGFNIPSNALVPFQKGCFGRLTKNEKQLLETFAWNNSKKFYIIGTINDSPQSTLRHEIAHGLWYVSDRYQKKMQKMLSALPKELIASIKSWILSKGCYDQSVIDDELHAYLITDPYSIWKIRGISISKRAQKTIFGLRAIFEKEFSEFFEEKEIDKS
jgi:hypothetical protein